MTPEKVINIYDKKNSRNFDHHQFILSGESGDQLIVKFVELSLEGQRIIRQGDTNMDESTKMLLDRLDRDLREHRQEIRDRDARLQAEFQEREQRIREETKEREERILRALQEIKQDMADFKSEIRQDIEDFKSEIRKDVTDIKEDNRAMRSTLITLTISVMVGIAGAIIAFITSR